MKNLYLNYQHPHYQSSSKIQNLTNMKIRPRQLNIQPLMKEKQTVDSQQYLNNLFGGHSQHNLDIQQTGQHNKRNASQEYSKFLQETMNKYYKIQYGKLAYKPTTIPKVSTIKILPQLDDLTSSSHHLLHNLKRNVQRNRSFSQTRLKTVQRDRVLNSIPIIKLSVKAQVHQKPRRRDIQKEKEREYVLSLTQRTEQEKLPNHRPIKRRDLQKSNLQQPRDEQILWKQEEVCKWEGEQSYSLEQITNVYDDKQ